MNKAGIALVISLLICRFQVQAQEGFTAAEISEMFTLKIEEIKKKALQRSFKFTDSFSYKYCRYMLTARISKPEEEGGAAIKRSLSCYDDWDPWHPDKIERKLVYSTMSLKEHESIIEWVGSQSFTAVDNKDGKQEYFDGKRRWLLWEVKKPSASRGIIWFYFFSIDNLSEKIILK